MTATLQIMAVLLMRLAGAHHRRITRDAVFLVCGECDNFSHSRGELWSGEFVYCAPSRLRWRVWLWLPCCCC